MVKRLLPLLVLLVCLPALSLALSAVNDEANLYTSDQISRMEAIINRIRSTYQMNAVVLTTYNVPDSYGDDSVTVRYADKWYEDNGCGLGNDRAGVVLIVDMNNRYNYLSTAGVMIDYLNDRRIEGVLTAADDYLSAGNYGSAMIAELTQLERYCADGIEEGSFRYDEVTGERLSGLYNKLTRNEMIFAGIAGIGAAAILWAAVMARYKLSGGTYRYALRDNAHVALSQDEEHFTHQTTTRTRIQSSSGGGSGGHGGGSGVHISSGGMSHGGGGHHF